MFNAKTVSVLVSVCGQCLSSYPTITLCSSNQHLHVFLFFLSSDFFSCFILFYCPHLPLCFFCNPFQAISCFSLSLFSPRHSFSPSLLCPAATPLNLWSRESREREESAALTLSISTFVLSFSPDMIWVIRLGDAGSLCAVPFLLPCEFLVFFLLTPASLENLNLPFIAPQTCFSLLIKPPRQS